VIAYITVRARGPLATTDHDVKCGPSKSDNNMRVHVNCNRVKSYLFHIYKTEPNQNICIDMHMQNAYSSGTVAHAIFSNRTWKMQTASEPCHQAKWTLPPDDAFSPAQHFSLLCITFLCRNSAAKQQLRPSRGPAALGASRRSRRRRQVKSPERSAKESPPPSTSASSPSGPLPSSSAQHAQQLLRTALLRH
jgi:hypothetical protein